MLPSTDLKASAPRTIAFSVLNSPAHPYRCRRFACPLAGANARLAEKRGLVTPSFQGTCTPNLLPVRLAHQITVGMPVKGLVIVSDYNPRSRLLPRVHELAAKLERPLYLWQPPKGEFLIPVPERCLRMGPR